MAFLKYRGSAIPTVAWTVDSADGASLTNTDIDTNFYTLNAQKLDVAGGSITGNLVIGGALTVNGSITTINSTTISVDDKNIELGSVATPTELTADGGGITLKGATDKTFNWVSATSAWTSSEHLAIAPGKTLRVSGSTSGVAIVTTAAVAGTPTITLPATTGTLALTSQLPTVNDASLTLTIGPAGATNTTVTIGTGTGFTANDVTDTTYDIKVGPALTNLATTMATAGAGFIKRGATADTYTIDTASYLSGTVPIGNGGTNITTYATGDILYASATNVLSKLAKGTDGQVLKLASGLPAWGTDNDTVYTASTGLTLTGTAFSVNYGTTSTTACVGNDARLSDARQASDVAAWAKAASNTSGAVMIGNGAAALGAVAPGASGNVLSSNGTSWVSSAPGASGASLSNDVTTDASCYPLWSTTTSGTPTTVYTSDSKLYFNPLNGTLCATGFNSLSDKTLKDNIIVIQDATNKIKSISGVEFTWKDTGKKSAGVIAQDLEEEMPWLVDTSSDGIKSVNYSGLSAYLIETIKQLVDRIQVLENK